MSRLSIFLVSLSLLTSARAFVGPQPYSRLQQSTKSAAALSSRLAYKSTGNAFNHHTALFAGGNIEKESKLPFWLDPNTKGGAIVLTVVLFAAPVLVYNVMTSLFGLDEIETGKWIGIGFTVVASVAWLGSYLFRVVNKDMTYVSNGVTVAALLL
jgi:Protein of unknown function (DUF3007)